ncbi:HD domain-containing protein [Streptomyces sp. I6]|uniref:HD-GYP domain-containing protein n=1 Tax=Streptomyces sp. I6 TaxID=2483113 RepID=UPI002880687D|nr:HD domain-containing protein [Streptomyces sp. I6]
MKPAAPGTVTAVNAAAALLAAAGLGWTGWQGVAEPGVALAFGLMIAVGELARRGARPGEREPAPLGAASALAYALLGANAGQPTSHGIPQTVAVTTAGVLAGAVPYVARGRGPALDHVTRRVVTVTFAAVCVQPLHGPGAPAERLAAGPGHVLALLLVLVLTALCDAVLASLVVRARTLPRGAGRTAGAPVPFGPLLRDELRSLTGVGCAVCATGAAMALGTAVAGLWAPPVFCLPLLLTRLSLRRFAAVRTTYRQTIASLARATEIAGYTPHGHARRVAALSALVGREMGLSGPDLTVLEYAALMHDIGQLSLVDPVPEGATALLPAPEQRRIALLGGAVVRQTGVPPAVAVVVERQADPYREQPLPARIVRTVNAYDDLTGDSARSVLSALERLRLGTAHDYQPEVVESLARVLSRGVSGPLSPGNPWVMSGRPTGHGWMRKKEH